MTASSSPPLIMVCANQAWNLLNFRADLIAALIAAGCRVIAVAPSDSEIQPLLAGLGAEFVPLPVDSKGLTPHRDLATYLAIRSLLRKHRPDAWLSWTIKPNIYGAMAAAGCGIPAFPNVSGLGTAFIRRNLLTKAVKLLYRWGFRRASVVFFQNGHDRDEFVNSGLIAPTKARILPGSGIDTRRFVPQPGGRPTRRRFLMLARVVADKGVREFVAAARQIRERWPDAQFILMGAIGAPNRTAIAREEVDGWVAEGVIQHLDPVSDVRPQIARADFVVLPSYREGLSRVLLEAGAMGRPAITTAVPGCQDIITEGINGFLCEPRDATSLVAALEKAAQTQDRSWQAMSVAACEKVAVEFSVDRVIAKYIDALNEAGIRLHKVAIPQAS